MGSAIVWLGAITFPGMDLENIAAHRPDHLFTTVFFMLGAVLTLAGFTVFTALVRESGNSVFAELGLVAFLFGSVFWAIHLAFRAVVMVSAAEEMLVSGAAPSWYHSWRLIARLDVRALHDERIPVDGSLRWRHAEVRVGGKGLGAHICGRGFGDGGRLCDA